jgi:Uma2 family endonuclease
MPVVRAARKKRTQRKPRDLAAHYTYADFLEWDESERYEIIDGTAVKMPAPVTPHQKILVELLYQIRHFLHGKTAQVFVAPYSVRLCPAEDLSDDTVLEPDIVVICDPSKIDYRGCNGAPDMVVEILSPSTARYDWGVKLRKYQEAGVREYWIADPDTKSLATHLLENGVYAPTQYGADAKVPVSVLPGCVINLLEIFGY